MSKVLWQTRDWGVPADKVIGRESGRPDTLSGRYALLLIPAVLACNPEYSIFVY